MAAYFGVVASLLITFFLCSCPQFSQAACTTFVDLGSKCSVSELITGQVTPTCCEALKTSNAEGCFCDAGIMKAAAGFGFSMEAIVNVSTNCGVDPGQVAVVGAPACLTTSDGSTPPPPSACNVASIGAAFAQDCADAETAGTNVSASCCSIIATANKNKCFCLEEVSTLVQAMPGKVAAVVKGCNITDYSLPGMKRCTNATIPDLLSPPTSIAPAAAPSGASSCYKANYIQPIAENCSDSYTDPTALPSPGCCKVIADANDALCFCAKGIAELIKVRPNIINNVAVICNISSPQIYGLQGCGNSTVSSSTSGSAPPPPTAHTTRLLAPHLRWMTLSLTLLLLLLAI